MKIKQIKIKQKNTAQAYKWKYKAVFAAILGASLLAGCQETPKNSIVKQKSTDNMNQYESTEEAKGNISNIVKAPETYKNKATYENGALVIDTDAEIILPEADSINTYKVSAQEASQELFDKVTKAFFEGDKIYHAHGYYQWTKERYQEEITKLKKYKSEGNLDPYGYGTDENGELMFRIDEEIARNEAELEHAPDEIEKKEVTPSFGLEWVNGTGEEAQKEVDKDSFWGVAETGNGIYNYLIKRDGAEHSKDITIRIEKERDDGLDAGKFPHWLEEEYLMDIEREDFHSLSEETLKGLAGISYEDAEKIAKEPIEKLGWDLELNGWGYTAYYDGEGNPTEKNILDGGYIFYFTRVLDGMPITNTSAYGGGLENHDSTLVPWSYERCEVIVGDDGIQKAEIFSPYNLEGIQTENVKLMDFDSIVKIYEQMMEVSNADISELEKQKTYHIKKIKLGYSRIYDPTVDSSSGILVPVWDFFGGFDVETDGYSEQNNGEHSTTSYMTINAIDGTVIDRGLGY